MITLPERWAGLGMIDLIADGFGFAAGLATILAFGQTTPLRMRCAAVAANVFFIVYGLLGWHLPPLVLHVILLPINLFYLADLARRLRSAA